MQFPFFFISTDNFQNDMEKWLMTNNDKRQIKK